MTLPRKSNCRCHSHKSMFGTVGHKFSQSGASREVSFITFETFRNRCFCCTQRCAPAAVIFSTQLTSATSKQYAYSFEAANTFSTLRLGALSEACVRR